MIEILSLPEIRERARPISVEAYHRMIDAGEFDSASVELLDGIIIEKMSKSPLHILLVDLLLDLLKDFCPRNEFWVRKEDPITISNSEPEPDISVIRGARPGLAHAKPSEAQFVVEVAISTLAVDRAKATHYAGAGIPEYWLIRPEDRVIEALRDPDPAGRDYQTKLTVQADETLAATALPGFEFNLSDALASVER